MKRAPLIAWTIFSLLLLGIVLSMAVLAQSSKDEVPIAGFVCRDGFCWTTEQELDRMETIWKLMEKRILECAGMRT